jgi:hypothetical protein
MYSIMNINVTIFFQGDFVGFLSALFSTVSSAAPQIPEDAGIEPRIVATSALVVRRSNHSARSHPHVRVMT